MARGILFLGILEIGEFSDTIHDENVPCAYISMNPAGFMEDEKT